MIGFLTLRKLGKLEPLYQLVKGTQPSSVAEKGAAPVSPPAKAPVPRPHHPRRDQGEENPPPADVTPLGSLPAPETPEKPAYGVMIVGTGSSYSAIKDLGIFRNESVYTVYLDMEVSGTPAPAWILQYAPLRNDAAGPAPARRRSVSVQSLRMEPPVVAPTPLEKVYPQFPPEVVAKNPGKMILVYSVINAEGKMEQTRILPSPVPALNQPVLDALRQWAFRPAKRNGEPVAVKALLGIVLPEDSGPG
jgi:hypothetical protein